MKRFAYIESFLLKEYTARLFIYFKLFISKKNHCRKYCRLLKKYIRSNYSLVPENNLKTVFFHYLH